MIWCACRPMNRKERRAAKAAGYDVPPPADQSAKQPKQKKEKRRRDDDNDGKQNSAGKEETQQGDDTSASKRQKLEEAEGNEPQPQEEAPRESNFNDNTTVFVANLAFKVVEDDLREEFSSCGEVKNVRLIRDKNTNRSRGFAYVQMASNEAREVRLLMLVAHGYTLFAYPIYKLEHYITIFHCYSLPQLITRYSSLTAGCAR